MYQYKYPHPALTADCVVFGYDGQTLHTLLIERGLDPYKGHWALPGGFMRMDESIEECARRELREETGVSNAYLSQLKVFSAPGRDPRERVVTVAFYALVRKSDYRLIAGDDAARAAWFQADQLPPLAFDHAEIIAEARKRLAEDLRDKRVAFNLLDTKFSMGELQRLCEVIMGETYDRRNFARKMMKTGLLQAQGVSAEPQPNRPPELYSLRPEDVGAPSKNKRGFPFDI